jgi:hypothetical protein
LAARPGTGRRHRPSRPVPGFEGWLARVGDGEGLAGFRGPVLSALACYARRHGPDALAGAGEELKRRVRERIAEAPKGPGRGDDLERYGSDPHLDEMIGWLADRERAARRASSLDAVRAVLRRAS